MKSSSLFLSCLMLAIAAASEIRAETFVCPPDIQIRQTLSTPLPTGWTAGEKDPADKARISPGSEDLKVVSTYKAGMIKIYRDEPTGDRLVAYTERIATPPAPTDRDAPIQLIWRFADADPQGRPLWLACAYPPSWVEFARPLPRDVRLCRARYDGHQSLEAIECE